MHSIATFIGLPVRKEEIPIFFCSFSRLLGKCNVTLLGTDFAMNQLLIIYRKNMEFQP
jgi:hypothetical protein